MTLITSAKFMKGLTGPNAILETTIPQVAFIGRSNVGKSSLINTLVNQKKLAITSSHPGRTREINVYSINREQLLFLDLPGYGYARASKDAQEKIMNLIHWYLLGSSYQQKKVVLIVDGLVGMTANDESTLASLEEADKDIVLVINKIDKIKKSEFNKKIKAITDKVTQPHTIIQFSSEKKIGIKELTEVLLG